MFCLLALFICDYEELELKNRFTLCHAFMLLFSVRFSYFFNCLLLNLSWYSSRISFAIKRTFFSFSFLNFCPCCARVIQQFRASSNTFQNGWEIESPRVRQRRPARLLVHSQLWRHRASQSGGHGPVQQITRRSRFQRIPFFSIF